MTQKADRNKNLTPIFVNIMRLNKKMGQSPRKEFLIAPESMYDRPISPFLCKARLCITLFATSMFVVECNCKWNLNDTSEMGFFLVTEDMTIS